MPYAPGHSPRCPGCDRRLHHRGTALHWGVLSCDSCHRLHFVLLLSQAPIAMIVEITRQESRALRVRGAGVAEVLAFLGFEVRS